MLFSFFADLLLVIHFGYILFVIFGGLLLLRWRWIWKLHLPAVIWGILVQYFVWICPLTEWENYFRSLGGEAGYSDGFINHYLTMLLYPDINIEFHTTIAIALILINFAIYFYIFYRKN